MSDGIVRTPHLIVLANEPRMLRDMLQRALDNTPGFIVVDQTDDLNQLTALFQQVQIDWLVVTLDRDGNITREAQTCFKRIPSLSLLALAADAARADVFLKTTRQGVLKFSLIEMTLAALVSILRYKSDDPHLPAALSALRAFQSDASHFFSFQPGHRIGRLEDRPSSQINAG
jgi:DNA-binding NarL/FixJ family response regulator